MEEGGYEVRIVDLEGEFFEDITMREIMSGETSL
jgi:hypothetical protein